MHIELILGGARSGKSRHALRQDADEFFSSKIFLATASAADQEMTDRIQRHRAERDASWRTVEEPYHLTDRLEKCAVEEKGLIVLDCATLWISNLLCGIGGEALNVPDALRTLDNFLVTIPKMKGRLRVVSNEVGLGIVPENLLARQFRDLQGTFNQRAASIASQVILMTAGIPQKLK